MNPEDLYVSVDGEDKVKIGVFLLPAEDFSLTQFLLNELGTSWLHPGGMQSTIKMLERLKIQPGMRVLDLGCGVGSATRLLAKKYNCDVVGLDNDFSMIEKAKQSTPDNLNEHISFQQGDGEKMSFSDDEFDLVIVQSVACFNNKEIILKEILRVLKPGGKVGLNEVTWLKPPTEKVKKVTCATICETFNGALTKEEWEGNLEQANLTNITSDIEVFEAVSPFQLLREEGFFKTLKITARVLFKADINTRINAVSSYLKNYNGFFGYGIYIGQKPLR